MFVSILHNGVIYKIKRQVFEPLDMAYKRLWFIAHMSNDTSKTMVEKECLAHMHVNEKYYKIKYRETNADVGRGSC
jgi:hypothetical protein